MQQPSKLLLSSRFLDRVGRENIMPSIQAALDRAPRCRMKTLPAERGAARQESVSALDGPEC
jgi:hypothetical protein